MFQCSRQSSRRLRLTTAVTVVPARWFRYCAPRRQSDPASYKCDLDEEPVDNYKPGGYYPIKLGDRLGDDRYEILHKVGWGAFSTVWAARDHEKDRNVALKILQAAVGEHSHENRGSNILRGLRGDRDAADPHRGTDHVVRLHDEFHQEGPNGSHRCLVLDLTGPSLQSYISDHGLLPLDKAKHVARQILLAVSYLHSKDIGHGDLHLRNLVLGVPTLSELPPSSLLSSLGDPLESPVINTDSHHAPPTLISPAAFPKQHLSLSHLKLLDFGAAFTGSMPPRTILTPPLVAPPEAALGDPVDRRADLWSAGCAIFELLVGRTPFESEGTRLDTPDDIVRKAFALLGGEGIPERWRAQGGRLRGGAGTGHDGGLEGLVRDLWAEKRGEGKEEEVQGAGRVIAGLIRLEPGERKEADEVLEDEWFRG